MDSAERGANAPAPIRIEASYSAAPRQVQTVALVLPSGATLGDALQASGLLATHGLAADAVRCGVWGRVQVLDHVLRDGDRVEIYRPLRVDPKEARRLRYKRQRRA